VYGGDRRRLLLLHLVGTRRREARARDIEVTQARTREYDGLAREGRAHCVAIDTSSVLTCRKGV
jgi:hypothetical protein